MSNKFLLKANNISKTISNTEILSDVSFKINQGEWVALLGHNGSGKTSLVEILSGISKQSSGNYEYTNEWGDGFRKHIGVQFQQSSFPHALTVKNMIKLAFEAREMKFDSAKCKEFLKAFEMEDLYKRKANKLSGGQKQKINLIMSIIHKPPFLFLDEFSTGLDMQTRKRVLDFLIEMKNKHSVSGLVVSHNMDDIERICDRVIVLENGKKVHDIALKEILSKYKSLDDFYFEKILGKGKNESIIKLY